jgi:cell division protein FtsW
MDLPLLVVTMLLVLVGFAMVLSASAPVAEIEHGDGLFFLKKQAVWGSLGMFALAVGSMISLDRLRALSGQVLVVSAILLTALHVPHLGATIYGSTRWLKFGPLLVQPSEIAKLALICFTADVLARLPRDGWRLFVESRQILMPLGGTLFLVLIQPDLGTTLVSALALYVMFWCSGTPRWLLGGAAGLGVVGVLVLSLSTTYQRNRWLALMDPWAYPKDIGFQIIQSLLAVGSGGMFGLGYGQGKQKLFYLPIQHADFIFAVLAEELGLMGSLGLIALFAFFGYRGLVIARRALNPFHQLLAVGITGLIVGQALTNLGVVTACLPTTGIPLPFVSAGGTSLMVTMFSVGLLMNVSSRTSMALRLAGPSGETR